MTLFSTSSSTSPSTTTNREAVREELEDLANPILNVDFVHKVLEDWSRPLPKSYAYRPLVIVGPSGVGKGRLTRALLADYKRFFEKVITHTTRPARPAWQVVEEKGKIPLLEIDIQGAKTLKSLEQELKIDPIYFFIAPPSIEQLRERLLLRGSETHEEIELRLKNAKEEIIQAKHSVSLFHEYLVNDQMNVTINTFFRLVRDHYPALPSAAQIRKLQRTLRLIKLKASQHEAGGEEKTQQSSLDSIKTDASPMTTTEVENKDRDQKRNNDQ
eukprot:gene530-569_t